jgi:hypothetical protein
MAAGRKRVAKKQGHRSNKRGTLRLDLRTPIGRIARASGTSHLPTLNKITAMLKEFGTQEPLRLDILRALRDGNLEPLIVYDAYRSRRLDELPTTETLRAAALTLDTWLLTADCGEKQRAAHKTAIKHLKAVLRKGAPITDLPSALREVKQALSKEGHAAQFNRVRSSLQAFLRDTLGRSHQVYRAVAEIGSITERKARKNNPQTVAQILELARAIAAPHVGTLWGMALTGMGPKEFFDGWSLGAAGVRIPGTKREARDRIVPPVLVDRFTGANNRRELDSDWRARKFADALRAASGGSVQPYDLRRTYANWIEAAGIPRTRRKLYMGHAVGDVTELYEQHEVDAFLAEDALKLEAFVRSAERETLKLEGASA